MAVKQSAALVFIVSDSGEDYITVDGNDGDRYVMLSLKWGLILDRLSYLIFLRKNLTAWHGGDALVLAVAAQNNNTIVIVNSVGPLILEPWIEHPNVTAVRISYSCFAWSSTPNVRLYGLVCQDKKLVTRWRMFCMVLGTRLGDCRIQLQRVLRIILLMWLLVESRPKYWASRILKGEYWLDEG